MSVSLYAVQRFFDGVPYEDAVCARSWEEAEILAERMGGEVTGKIVEEIFVSDEEMNDIFHSGDWTLGKTHTDGY